MDKYIDGWVDRHEYLQRHNAAGIAKRGHVLFTEI